MDTKTIIPTPLQDDVAVRCDIVLFSHYARRASADGDQGIGGPEHEKSHTPIFFSSTLGSLLLLSCTTMSAQAQVMRKKDAPIQAPPIPTVPLDHSAKETGIQQPPPGTYEIRCRGPVDDSQIVDWDTNPNVTSNSLLFSFIPSSGAAGADGSGLTPGTCSWIDRPFSSNEPREIQYIINDVSDQNKHRNHLKQPNSYWSFFVVNTNPHYFEAKLHQRWDYQVKVEPAPSKEVDIEAHEDPWVLKTKPNEDVEAHEDPWVLKTKPNEDVTVPAPTYVTVKVVFETLHAPNPIGRLRFDIKSKNEFTSKDQTDVLDKRYTGYKGVPATLNKRFTINDALPLLGIEVKAEGFSWSQDWYPCKYINSVAAEYDLTEFSGYNRTIPFTLDSPETDDQERPGMSAIWT